MLNWSCQQHWNHWCSVLFLKFCKRHSMYLKLVSYQRSTLLYFYCYQSLEVNNIQSKVGLISKTIFLFQNHLLHSSAFMRCASRRIPTSRLGITVTSQLLFSFCFKGCCLSDRYASSRRMEDSVYIWHFFFSFFWEQRNKKAVKSVLDLF